VSTDKTYLKRKHLWLDNAKLKRVQELLGAETEAQTVDRALDHVIEEHRRDRLAWEANQRFLSSGAEIKDVYGKLTRRHTTVADQASGRAPQAD
jgi:hypothetical protein